ncbi:hypothetical protein [Variovorax sp. PBL-E5]|nr:hypothetical protein [Variovorax sp. PBL-E5]VTU45464.1 hypothetical protein E5P2_00187 [Variovorax sp. PBL-E5]
MPIVLTEVFPVELHSTGSNLAPICYVEFSVLLMPGMRRMRSVDWVPLTA